MTEKLYAERDPMQQDVEGNYYCKHVSAMTDEDLHSKSAIAAELAHRDIVIDRLKVKQESWGSQMAQKENEVTKHKVQLAFMQSDNERITELNDNLKEQLKVFTEMDTEGAEFGKYVLTIFQQHDILVQENRDLRVALDYQLRAEAGLVTSEADKFYDSERATFQQELEDFESERHATGELGG